MTLSFYFCIALEFVLVSAILINSKNFREIFKNIKFVQWVCLFVLLFAALLIRAEGAPHRHYVFYDEYEHFATAKNLFENKMFSRPDFYLDGIVYSSYLPQWLPGYHSLLAQFFQFFGVKESMAFDMNVVFSSLCILLLFLGGYLISYSFNESFAMACLLAFLPLHVKFAGNASLETVSLFFNILTFFSCMLFLRKKSHCTFFLLMASLAFAMMIRAENILLLPLVILFIVMNRISVIEFWPWFPMMFLFIPPFLYISHIRDYMLWQWIGPRSHLSPLNFFSNSLLFWIRDIAVPVILPFFALGGLIIALKKRYRIHIWLAVYFFAFISVYAFVEKLNLNIGETQRFNLMLCFPVIILAGLGMTSLLQKFRWASQLNFMKFLLLVLLTVNYIVCFPYVRSEIANPVFSKEHGLYFRGKNMSEKCVFVAYNPCAVITILQRSAVNIAYLFEPEIFNKYLTNRRLVLVKDYWCDTDPSGYYQRLLKTYRLERIDLSGQKDNSLFYLIENKN